MKDNFPIEIIKRNNPSFPERLARIPSCPPQIFFKGKINPPKNSVAIVGTRRATEHGIKAAHKIAKDLAYHNVAIISGLAIGIDTAAHKGALDGGGITWAVLACGLNNIYPSVNSSLARDILSNNGCLVSEYPPKTPSYPNQFLARNRIISGLSKAVIVIEAPRESGALATAKFAIEQGKDVFVISGPFGAPTFEGSWELIRNGATPVFNTKELLEHLGITQTSAQKTININMLNSNEQLVINTLKNSSKALMVDKIVAITKLMPQDVNIALSGLVFNDYIQEINGSYQISSEIYFV